MKKKIVIGLVAVLILIQFIRPTRNTATGASPDEISKGVRQFYMNLVSLKIRNSSTPMGSQVYRNHSYYKHTTPSGSNTSICKSVVHPPQLYFLRQSELRGKIFPMFFLVFFPGFFVSVGKRSPLAIRHITGSLFNSFTAFGIGGAYGCFDEHCTNHLPRGWR